MATLFYLPSTGAAAVSPPIGAGEWAHINTVRRPLNSVKGSSAIATTAFAPDAADHLVAGRSHFVQFVSDVLPPQTIPAQLVKMQLRCAEDNAGNNLFLNWRVLASSEDGTQLLGTILATKADGTEVGTALTNRSDSATTTVFTALQNFRLVLEIGLGGTPTNTTGVQGHSGSISFGENAANDLPEDDASTAALNPWMQFAQNLKFTQGNSVTFQFVEQCGGGGHTTFDVTLGSGASRRVIYETDDIRQPLSDLTDDQKETLALYVLKIHMAGKDRAAIVSELTAGPVMITI
jgi:hypothetical protein